MCNQGNCDVKNQGSKSRYGSRARTRLTLDKVLSGVFDDDFGLSDGESSDEEEKMSVLTLESII